MYLRKERGIETKKNRNKHRLNKPLNVIYRCISGRSNVRRWSDDDDSGGVTTTIAAAL